MTEHLPPPSSNMLTEDQRDIAAARARDRLWRAVRLYFDDQHADHGLSFAELGRRIGRTRSQVQRWLSSPASMTPASAGLICEGLDAELKISVQPRAKVRDGSNHVHPGEVKTMVVMYAAAGRSSPEATTTTSASAIQLMAHANG